MNSNFRYNKTEIPISEATQAGGVAVLTSDALTPRYAMKGVDPLGLDQWAWTRIEGMGGLHTRLVSVYRPCIPSKVKEQGPFTKNTINTSEMQTGILDKQSWKISAKL
jgi:hypothetical protein